MKRILIACFLVLALSRAAYANLVDLTPGGFNVDNGLPPAFSRLQTQLFFDEAAFGTFEPPPTFYDGWVSRFGVLNGGQFFFTDLFQISPSTSANIWWNFNGQVNGDWLSTIDVFGRTANGTPVENIYRVPWDDRLASPGNQAVTLDGIATIMAISFYGLNPATVPDGGTSFMLLGTTMLSIVLIRYFKRLQTH